MIRVILITSSKEVWRPSSVFIMM